MQIEMREKYKGFINRYGYGFEWYYLLVILAYILTLASDLVRPGVIATVLLLVVWAEVVVAWRIFSDGSAGKDKRLLKSLPIQDWLVLCYFFYNILSVIWLTRGGLPASVFQGEFVVSVLPMGFYFAGKLCSNVNVNENGKRLSGFYAKFTAAVLLVGIVGILLYIAAPQFYLDYSFRYSFISKADAPTMRVRMNSVVGCTLLGFLGTAGMMSGAYFLKVEAVSDPVTGKQESAGAGETKPSDKKGTARIHKKRVRKSRLFGIISIAVCLVAAIMSNQRSVLVSVILVMIYINYLLFFKLDLIPKKYFYVELGAVAAVFVLLCVIKFDVILKFWWRLASLPGAVSERSEQWIAAINNMYSTWLGNGLGANGHRALGIEGTHVIADGGLIKLYCEEGILGFSLFLYIIILAVKKGLRNVREYYVELGILALVFLQSIGSNIIAFQLATPIFWFAVGRIQAGDREGRQKNDLEAQV